MPEFPPAYKQKSASLPVPTAYLLFIHPSVNGIPLLIQIPESLLSSLPPPPTHGKMNEEIVNAYVESMFNFGHTAYLFSIDVAPLSVLPTLHGG